MSTMSTVSTKSIRTEKLPSRLNPEGGWLMDRRKFLQTSTLLASAAWLTHGQDEEVFGATSSSVAGQKMIGIQVGAVSFVDEGTGKVLDGFREMADINTLFLATF